MLNFAFIKKYSGVRLINAQIIKPLKQNNMKQQKQPHPIIYIIIMLLACFADTIFN
jgi:hypothetical protein